MILASYKVFGSSSGSLPGILDSTGNVKERLELAHLTSIHIDILLASQTGETLKPGTFLG